MKKRLLAILLTLAMVIGLTPITALEANATETDKVVLAENVTGNTYTDETAAEGESYEYTITGSDGSTQSVIVNAVAEDVDTTTADYGNKIVIQDVAADGKVYELTTAANVTAGTYLLVGGRSGYDYGYPVQASSGSLAFEFKNIIDSDDGSTINEEYTSYEWTLEASGDGFTFKTPDGKYLMITNEDASDGATIGDTADVMTIRDAGGTVTNAVFIWDAVTGGGLNYRDGGVGTWSGTDEGSCFFLYKKLPTTTTYILDLSGLKSLIAQSGNYTEANYTAASWETFANALTAAEIAITKDGTSYTTETDANTALTEANTAYSNLHNAILALTPNVTYNENGTVAGEQVAVPSILWQRTNEPANTDTSDYGDLKVGISYLGDTTDNTYPTIAWAWDAISDLTTDPSMTIWDYNTDSQYSNQTQATDVKAATWNEHEQTDDEGTQWMDASVRKFSGTFVWPKGYDTDDTASLVSVNDANYSAIYEYIDSDATLAARFGDYNVMAVNDDMYVFIYLEGDEPTADNYLEHLVFWTGTSGKGVWSASNSNNDWGRRTPATFNDVSALPAYYGIMPNNQDVSYDENFEYVSTNVPADKLYHTDSWYTLIDTSSVMSTLKNLYGSQDLSGKTLHIDAYCFDNSENGGMDQLELKLTKKTETQTTVTVNYYLDSVLAANLLGSSVMTGAEDGTEITLLAGTNVNELDYYRFAAATKAGTVVSNGVQQSPVPYIVDITKDNIINVVYKSKYADDSVYYFYDFGVENQYIYTPTKDAVLDGNYTITKVANTNPNIEASVINNGKDVLLSYTPATALGEMAVGTLNITFDGTYETKVKPIVIAPASNVLFEENFMSPLTTTDYANWTMGGTVDADYDKNVDGVDKLVTDNETTVFGYTDSYNTSVNDSGVYTATVNNETKFTDNLQFEFGGTGFDLIGTCGPNTGTIAVKVVNSAGESVKNYLIDTSFTDTTGVVSSGTTIYQVPLLQAKDLPEDTYTVTIRGAYIVYSSTSAASTYSLYGTESTGGTDAITDVYDLLYGVGMTDDDIDCVEYINMGKLMGASTYATSEESTETTSTTTTPAEMVISIDGFRSYRATDYDKYPTKELGVVYQNILDCVSNGFAAYIETLEDGTYQVNNYELSGGPQNEIYLTANNTDTDTTTGTSNALVVGQTNSVSKQISLRSVDGNAVTVLINGGDGQTNGKTITLEHTTEMYYEVTANDNGTIIIQVSSGFLGIGNLKLTSGDANTAAVMTTSLTEDDYALVATTMRLYAAAAAEPEVFEPETLEVDTKVQKNKYTITVTASSNVEYITVNGETITASRSKRGSDEKIFVYKGKLTPGEAVTIEVVAYNAEDVASEMSTYEVESQPMKDRFNKGRIGKYFKGGKR